jgi:hypothetical protein
MPENTVAKEVAGILTSPSIQAGITSWFWGIAHYLYVVSKWSSFNLYILFMNIFLAFWIGTVVYWFIPDNEIKGWLVGIVWFSTYPILSILEAKWVLVLEKYLHIKK